MYKINKVNVSILHIKGIDKVPLMCSTIPLEAIQHIHPMRYTINSTIDELVHWEVLAIAHAKQLQALQLYEEED